MIHNDLLFSFLLLSDTVQLKTRKLIGNSIINAISPTQLSILKFVKFNDLVTPSHVNKYMKMSMPNTSREINKLITKRFLTKVVNERDRRKYYLYLTSDGETLINEFFTVVENQFSKQIKNISNEDLIEIITSIEVLNEKLLKKL
ncbi:MarR family winged helix-turn-helix transcriptional regulator [Jeotgalibacillus alimentarius]|uniref:MarR family winged helix-turn-helix transcriptional regulator n=1 Tax=Jeotgalibacillus alimentarius TaxID=135826 RepID=UPI000698F22D|nr:MarR family transcriptional regulator [Jeotgalibacillus alimentarius]